VVASNTQTLDPAIKAPSGISPSVQQLAELKRLEGQSIRGRDGL